MESITRETENVVQMHISDKHLVLIVISSSFIIHLFSSSLSLLCIKGGNDFLSRNKYNNELMVMLSFNLC